VEGVEGSGERELVQVTAMGKSLAWRVMKLWMKSAGRTLNNYQVSQRN
jgi:hypothetical protein